MELLNKILLFLKKIFTFSINGMLEILAKTPLTAEQLTKLKEIIRKNEK